MTAETLENEDIECEAFDDLATEFFTAGVIKKDAAEGYYRFYASDSGHPLTTGELSRLVGILRQLNKGDR